MYFDYYQSDDKAQEPLAMGSGVTVEKVYGFEPVATELEKEEKSIFLVCRRMCGQSILPLLNM